MNVKDSNPTDEPDFFDGLSSTSIALLEMFGDQRTVEIETVMSELKLSRRDAICSFRELEDIGYVSVKIGRRGKATRAIFSSDTIRAVKCKNIVQKELINNESLLDDYLEIEKDILLEDALSAASLVQLINAIKDNHDVHRVHLVY